MQTGRKKKHTHDPTGGYMKQKKASMAREQKKNQKELRLQLMEKNIEELRQEIQNIREYLTSKEFIE